MFCLEEYKRTIKNIYINVDIYIFFLILLRHNLLHGIIVIGILNSARYIIDIGTMLTIGGWFAYQSNAGKERERESERTRGTHTLSYASDK